MAWVNPWTLAYALVPSSTPSSRHQPKRSCKGQGLRRVEVDLHPAAALAAFSRMVPAVAAHAATALAASAAAAVAAVPSVAVAAAAAAQSDAATACLVAAALPGCLQCVQLQMELAVFSHKLLNRPPLP